MYVHHLRKHEKKKSMVKVSLVLKLKTSFVAKAKTFRQQNVIAINEEEGPAFWNKQRTKLIISSRDPQCLEAKAVS